MRKLLTTVLLLASMSALAQTGDDDTPIARVFALDSSVAVAKAFNNNLVREIGGFVPAFVDSTKPKTVLSVYKSSGPDGLRIEFKYRNADNDEGQGANARQIVHYQKISANDVTMCKIFNYIFHTDVQPNQLRLLRNTGSMLKYKDASYMYILDEAEYRPGYWELTFVK